MSTLSQFLRASGPVVQQGSAFPVNNAASNNATFLSPISTLSGSMTIGVEKDILLINGRGRLLFVAFWANDNTPRVVKPRIRVDGNEILGAPSLSISASGNGCNLVGFAGFSGAGLGYGETNIQPIDFNVSMRFSLEVNRTETDSLTAVYRYEVWQ